jgi:hypothetical protein
LYKFISNRKASALKQLEESQNLKASLRGSRVIVMSTKEDTIGDISLWFSQIFTPGLPLAIVIGLEVTWKKNEL